MRYESLVLPARFPGHPAARLSPCIILLRVVFPSLRTSLASVLVLLLGAISLSVILLTRRLARQ